MQVDAGLSLSVEQALAGFITKMQMAFEKLNVNLKPLYVTVPSY